MGEGSIPTVWLFLLHFLLAGFKKRPKTHGLGAYDVDTRGTQILPGTASAPSSAMSSEDGQVLPFYCFSDQAEATTRLYCLVWDCPVSCPAPPKHERPALEIWVRGL